MRVVFSTAIAVLVLVGCSSKETSAKAEKCTDLITRSVQPRPPLSPAQARRYVKKTYCDRFAREGWVYDDGALSIDAQEWLVHGGKEVCATQTPGGPTATVPCEQLEAKGAPQLVDCAMLRFVRRSEVRTYIAELQKDGTVVCDEGTPLTALGVP